LHVRAGKRLTGLIKQDDTLDGSFLSGEFLQSRRLGSDLQQEEKRYGFERRHGGRLKE
jgi:hypothetical protein